MNILVLNGSPHGVNGVTAQYTQYLATMFSEYTFTTVEIAKKINKLEHNRNYFNEVVQQLEQADIIIWAFPVYTMLVPSQLKKFIELLFENNCKKILNGKIATGISTSANFYDHSAHNYVHEISSDLGLRYVRGFSAEMKDLLSETGRENFLGFARDFFWKVEENNILEDRTIPAVNWTPANLSMVELPPAIEKNKKKSIVIISDANPHDHNLLKMLDLFEHQVSFYVERIELRDIKMKGGCIGCLKCGSGDACFYQDDYAAAFEKVKQADVVIYAGAVKDRYYSARFKKFIDRYFSNGHRHVLRAGLLGHIVSGPLNQLASMRETLEAHIEVAHCQRLGIISDESQDPEATAQNITNMVKYLEHWMANPQWQTGQTFLGVGGHKIFRDLVYVNRGVMCADYNFYKQENILDFPNTNYRQRMFSKLQMIMQKIPSIKKSFKKDMNKHRIMPYQKVLEEANSK